MKLIQIGFVLVVLAISLILVGIIKELDKKFVADKGYSVVVIPENWDIEYSKINNAIYSLEENKDKDVEVLVIKRPPNK